jgi:hypothetical protein
MTLAVSVGLFALGGRWLDAQLGSSPWLLLLGVGCGIVGGMLHMVRVLAPELWPFGRADRATHSSGVGRAKGDTNPAADPSRDDPPVQP